MATKFNEKALIQLHKYNCPVSIDASDNILIDVAVKKTLKNDLVFTCPFCVSTTADAKPTISWVNESMSKELESVAKIKPMAVIIAATIKDAVIPKWSTARPIT